MLVLSTTPTPQIPDGAKVNVPRVSVSFTTTGRGDRVSVQGPLLKWSLINMTSMTLNRRFVVKQKVDFVGPKRSLSTPKD